VTPIPWSPVQLWRRHTVAFIVGFTPSLLVLAFLFPDNLDAPLPFMINAIGWLGWGLALARSFAGQLWITAYLLILLSIFVSFLFTLSSCRARQSAVVDPTPSVRTELDAFRHYTSQLVDDGVGFDYLSTMMEPDRTDVGFRVSKASQQC